MADQLRGGSTAGGYPIVTKKEVPMTFRVDAGKLQYSTDGGASWADAEYSTDATAAANQILSGQTAYVGGSKITGTMPNRGTANYTLPINGSYTIPSGYHNGSGVVSQSITTKGAQTFTPGTSNQTIGAGQYLSGTQTILGDPDLIASNIRSGKNIFGVAGNLVDVKYASGSTTSTTISATVGFQPQVIIARNTGIGGAWFITDAAELPYRALNASHTYQIYYANCVYMSYSGSCSHTNVTSITTTGFTIALPGASASGTFEWVAYGMSW
jgi:hypothetical protein